MSMIQTPVTSVSEPAGLPCVHTMAPRHSETTAQSVILFSMPEVCAANAEPGLNAGVRRDPAVTPTAG